MFNPMDIFQKKALDKMQRPERNYTGFTVVKPVGWLLLCAVGLFLFSVLMWGIWGILADKTMGYGAIVGRVPLQKIVTSTGGRVKSMRVSTGDKVHEKEIVANMETPQTERDLLFADEQMGTAKSRAEIQSYAAKITLLKEQLHKESEVVSYATGRVVGTHVKEGEVVSAGTALYTVQPDATEISHAVMFVNAFKGGKVRTGMTVRMEVSGVDPNYGGYLIGIVDGISSYPIQIADIEYYMSSTAFSQWIANALAGPVLMLRVRMIKDETTPSQYMWTNNPGPKFAVVPGTVFTGTVISDRHSPIAKALGKFNQWIRRD